MADWNEQEKTEALEQAAGGPDRTFRLMRMLEDCRRNLGTAYDRMYQDAGEDERRFRERAKREGYSPRAIRLMLDY